MAKLILNNALLLIQLLFVLFLIDIATSFSLRMSTNNNGIKTNAALSHVDRRSFVRAGTAAAAVTSGLVENPSQSIAVTTVESQQVSTDVDADGFITTESGMRYKVMKEGTGAIPSAGQTVKAQYTGWLDEFDSIRKFDSSRDRGRPFTFSVGKGQVIRGWDEAFSSMRVGEQRKLILPPRLAYGDRGAGGIIPGGATLYFDVELLGIL